MMATNGLYDSVKYIYNLPEVDRTRIGISGHSMGGYTTAMTLYQDSVYAGFAKLAENQKAGKSLGLVSAGLMQGWDTFFYADPPYFSTEDMYAVGFNWNDHVRLKDTLSKIQGKFLLSYNDCPEIRELYKGFSMLDFSRTHSMAQRYEAGKEFKELLISNYDLYERERSKPQQLTLFSCYGDDEYDYEKVLKECIVQCRIQN